MKTGSDHFRIFFTDKDGFLQWPSIDKCPHEVTHICVHFERRHYFKFKYPEQLEDCNRFVSALTRMHQIGVEDAQAMLRLALGFKNFSGGEVRV